MLKGIGKIIPEVDNKGSFLSWAYRAHDKLAWSILINKLGSNNLNLLLNRMVLLLIVPIPPFLLLPQYKNPQTPPEVLLSPPPSPSSFKTYSPNLKILFRILNLNPTSSLREVRRASYPLARKYNLNKCNEEISKQLKVESEERIKSISNAFEDLKMANYFS